MTASIPALLQPLKDRLAKITPGRWEVDRNYPFSQDLVGIFAKDEQRYVLQVENQDDVDDPTCDEDVQFIANAPTDQAKLIAAIDAVVVLHARGAGHNPQCKCGIPANADPRCRGCGEEWPCDTLTALTQALGGDTA